MGKRLALTLSAAALFSACGGQAGNSGSPPSAPGAPGADKAYEITVVYMANGGTPKDMQVVTDAINRITLPKIGATVKFVPVNVGSWTQQINLMLSSNEKLDLFPTGVGTFFGYNTQVAKGQILPMDGLLDRYGSGIKKAVGESYLAAGKVGGRIYGVPTMRDMAGSTGLIMRKDLVEKYGIRVSDIKTMDDVEKVFRSVKKKEPGLVPVVNGPSGTIVNNFAPIDRLGDDVGVLLNRGEELRVVNWFEQPEYETLLKKVRSWYREGFILQDAVTNKIQAAELVKTNRAFSYFVGDKPGIEAQESKATGIPMTVARLSEPLATTKDVAGLMWAIASQSPQPDKAMQFLNLLYEDPDVINLIDWGVEGKHYVRNEDGTIRFPDGVTAETNGYNLNQNWLWGNQFKSYIFEGDNPKLWEEMEAFNESAAKSAALGFTFNVDPVKASFTAVSNVLSQYQNVLEYGAVDPDVLLPEFREKLRTAGIRQVVEEKQKQLDAWKAAK